MSKIADLYHKIPRPIRLQIRGVIQKTRIAIGNERRFVRIEDYMKTCPEQAEFVFRADSQLRYASPRYEISDVSEVYDAQNLHGGVLRLRGASCFACSDIIQMADGRLWYELRDLYKSIGKWGTCNDGQILKADYADWYETQVPDRVEHLKTGFFLSGIFSGNYYHFVLAILPRLRWIDMTPKDVPLLVDHTVEKYASYQQLLAYCNEENRPLVFLDSNVRYEVDNLYVATTQMMAQPNYRNGQVLFNDDDQYNMAAMEYVRAKVLAHWKPIAGLPKRFFISRKNASGLRKFNEQDCIDALKSLGFEVVCPEEYSLDEQVSLFHQAECIIGGSGAAFTNIIFASETTKIIILEGYKSGICIFSTIASFVNAKLMYLYDKKLGKIPNGDYIHEDFCINPIELKNKVQKILGL